MVKLTESLEVFLFRYHKDILVLLSFGHTELMTDEIWEEYVSWCETDEAKPYLMGGEQKEYENNNQLLK